MGIKSLFDHVINMGIKECDSGSTYVQRRRGVRALKSEC